MWHQLISFISSTDANSITIISLIIGTSVAIILAYPSWIDYFQRKQINSAFGAEAYTEDEIKNAVRLYIEPDCSQMDPAGESDIRHAVLIRDSLFKNVNKFLDSGGSGKHLLVLADSGMGKTTFTLQFYWQNHKTSWNKKKRVAIVPLGRKNAVNAIKKIDRQNETILILDAFDEDTEALLDHKSRINELMEVAQDFKRVIVTSRTQFFSSDEEIPKETGVAIVSPRNNIGRTYKFYKLYLAPFNDNQVKQYIKKRFRFWQFSKRARTYKLVERVPELIVRPMLLAHIPDLAIESKISINSLAEFYSYMVETWLKREEGWVAPELLKNFSEKLAVDIFLNKDIRSMERISPNELNRLLNQNMPDSEHWKFKTRSFINRDAEGNYKFSHRSFMEYFFILAYLNGDKSCLSVKWTDMMITLFESAINAQLSIAKSVSINSDDFSKTGMFSDKPWLWREPLEISTRDYSESISTVFETRRNLQTHISIVKNQLKIWPLKEKKIEDQLIFLDLGVDLIWYVFRDARNKDYDLNTLPEEPAWKKKEQIKALKIRNFGGINDWRFPTVDEFEWIVITNKYIESEQGTGFLYNELFYLCSDISHNKKTLVVSFGLNPISNLPQGFSYLGSRNWEKVEHKLLNTVIHIYDALNLEDYSNRRNLTPFLCIAISHFGATKLSNN